MNAIVLQGARPSYLPAPTGSAAPSIYTAGLTGGGINLPFLSFRGKGFRLRKSGEEVPLGNTLSVILVAARPGISKRYYDKNYVPGEITPPRCWSDDGVTPQAGAEATIAPACAQCPMNVFGSGKRADGSASKGKACSDFRRVIVYPLVGTGDSAMVQATVLDVPATSFRAKKGEPPAFLEFGRTLEENNALVQAGDHWVGAVVAKLSFTDNEFPRLVWEAERWATDHEMANALEMAQSDDVAEALGAAPEGAEVPAGAPPAVAAPAAVPAEVQAVHAEQISALAAAGAAPADPVGATPAASAPDGDALVKQLQALLGGKA